MYTKRNIFVKKVLRKKNVKDKIKAELETVEGKRIREAVQCCRVIINRGAHIRQPLVTIG